MSIRAVNSPIYFKFYVGTTGIVAGSFAYSVEKDGIASAVTVSFSEDALGWYKGTITPTSTGIWTIRIKYATDFFYGVDWVVGASAVGDYQSGDTCRGRFYVGTTGLVQGDFTTLLSLDNASSVVSFTISEESTGWYDVYFVGNANGDWCLRMSYSTNIFALTGFYGPVGSGTTISFGSSEIVNLQAVQSDIYLMVE